MVDDSAPLPSTLAECHAWMKEMAAAYASLQAVHAKQQANNERQQATIEQQQATIDEQQAVLQSLQHDLALLKRSMFGQRRERFEDPQQRLLFDSVELDDFRSEDDQPEPGSATNEQKRPLADRGRGRVRRVFPDCLPRVQRIRKLDDDAIPEHLRGIAGRRFLKKVAEWVEWQPPQLQVVEELVETLAIDNEDATETAMLSAPREPRIINSFAGPSLLASLAVSRFADHQPYYRLEEVFSVAT